MTQNEFIEKWLVGYESLEQKLEFEIEMKADLASLTPCGELEKEVERLKGLIWEMYGDMGTALNIADEFIEKEKNNFKAKHNL